MARAGQKGKKSPKATERLRYAVVGLGHIAQAAILPAFQGAQENSELVALVSDSDNKLAVLGEQYGVSARYGYDDLEDCINRENIDAVFIALPNSLHREFVLRSIHCGAHVLCEKPLGVNAQECREMDRAARQFHVYLMTAYRLHFDDANMEVVRLVRDGKIGEPRIFSSVFSFQVSPDNIRVKARLGGGALADIGLYAVNAARYVFQSEPIQVLGTVFYGDDRRFENVEGTAAATLVFSQNRVAQFACSFAATDCSYFEVVGSEGRIRLDQAYEWSEGSRMSIFRKNADPEVREFPQHDQFAAELVYFSDCVMNTKQPEPSAREAESDMRILEAIRHSADSSRSVALRLPHSRKRPDERQIIFRSDSSGEPPLVEVSSPHAQ